LNWNGCSKLWSSGIRGISHSAVWLSCTPE